MAAELFVLILLVAVVAPFILYVFIQAEHDQRETMDRQEAEQSARRDTRD